MEWREYHEFTKHTAERLRRARHYLDWANIPNPFRHYEGVPVLDLPADPPAPEIPALKVMNGELGITQAKDGAAFLSQLMFYSAAVSATKRAAASTYALRVNPSSGNLHPTEFHFCSRGLIGWADGLYHYRPSMHMAEQRALGDFRGRMEGSDAPLVFVLTSIAWREAWKYRDRAYRYCLHDMGHAWQSLTLAARAMGCESYAVGDFADDEVSSTCAVNGDEWPMMIVALRGRPIPVEMRVPSETEFYGGNANRLSEEVVPYPRIERMHAATKVRVESPPESVASAEQDGHGEIGLPTAIGGIRTFGEVVRMRRSALDFRGGDEWMTLSQLGAVMKGAGKPLFADFVRQRFVQLYLYVHRVVGLAPGVYRYWPMHAELEAMKLGDQQIAAAALSLGQELAGNACVAFSMIGDFESATRMFGDRGYRYVHFEAGAIGQKMYLASEAVGLRATGIGAFLDDEVHRYLGIAPGLGQVVYHFAIGYPVPDPRLGA